MDDPISMRNKPKKNKRRMNVFETETSSVEEEQKQAKTKAPAVEKSKNTKAPSETKESKTAAPSVKKMTKTDAPKQIEEKNTKAPTVKTTAPKMPKAPKTPRSIHPSIIVPTIYSSETESSEGEQNAAEVPDTGSSTSLSPPPIVPTIYPSETESSEGEQNAAEVPDTGSSTSLSPPPSETPSQMSSESIVTESPSMIDMQSNMQSNMPTETEMKELTSDEPTLSPNSTNIQFDFSEGCKELAEGKIKQTETSILVKYKYEITHDARRDLSDLLSVIEGDMEKYLGLSLLGCDTDETGNVIYDWRRHLMSEGGIVGVSSKTHEISTDACQVLAPADGNRCAVVDGKTRAYLTESGYGFVDGRAEEETLAAVRDFAMSGYNTSAYGDVGVEDLFYLGVPTETKSDGTESSSAIEAEDGAAQSMSALGVGLIVASGLFVSGLIYWVLRKKKLSEPKVY